MIIYHDPEPARGRVVTWEQQVDQVIGYGNTGSCTDQQQHGCSGIPVVQGLLYVIRGKKLKNYLYAVINFQSFQGGISTWFY